MNVCMYTCLKCQEGERIGVWIDVIRDDCHLANVVVIWVQELDGRASGKREERDLLSSFDVGHGDSVVLHQVLNIARIRWKIPAQINFSCANDIAGKVEGNNWKKKVEPHNWLVNNSSWTRLYAIQGRSKCMGEMNGRTITMRRIVYPSSCFPTRSCVSSNEHIANIGASVYCCAEVDSCSERNCQTPQSVTIGCQRTTVNNCKRQSMQEEW